MFSFLAAVRPLILSFLVLFACLHIHTYIHIYWYLLCSCCFLFLLLSQIFTSHCFCCFCRSCIAKFVAGIFSIRFLREIILDFWFALLFGHLLCVRFFWHCFCCLLLPKMNDSPFHMYGTHFPCSSSCHAYTVACK